MAIRRENINPKEMIVIEGINEENKKSRERFGTLWNR
jgi:hypothetical protein